MSALTDKYFAPTELAQYFQTVVYKHSVPTGPGSVKLKCEIHSECAALARFGCKVNGALMRLGRQFHDRKPQAAAAIPTCAWIPYAVETIEDASRALRGNADTCI